MQTLNNVQALIIDMDGVLWNGSEALPGLQSLYLFYDGFMSSKEKRLKLMCSMDERL